MNGHGSVSKILFRHTSMPRRDGTGGHVDVKQLKALVTVVETGSVTRAGELLHLVQPAVTRQIRALEREIGVALFERTRHGMRPTAAGLSLAERARRALTELDRARAELAPVPGVVAGLVTVGLLESTAELLAEPLVTAVRREHPDIELRLLIAYSGHLQQWLDDGDLDVSLLYNLASTPSLNVRPLLREKLWVVGAAADGLRADQPVALREVAARPVILPAPGHGLRVLIDQAVVQAQVQLAVAVQTNSMSLQKQLVRHGHGWTILPGAGAAADVAAGTLSAAPLSQPEVWRSVVIGAPRAGLATQAAQAVASHLTRQAQSAAGRGAWPSAELQDSAG
jgi:LysR family transcriptional regulator, nitrogen assimilation regulatory protein